MYLEDGSLNVVTLGRGYSWFDTGTMDSLFHASELVRVVENSQHVQIASIEEIAYRKGWITSEQLLAIAEPLKKNHYGEYLIKLAQNGL